MQKAIAQDKLQRAEEESLRMNIYGWLTAEAWRAWSRGSADDYDRAERDARGLVSFRSQMNGAALALMFSWFQNI